MPTRGRQQYAREAVDCFLAQTYPNKELLILDDEDDPSFPNGIEIPGVHYQSKNIRYNIPQKRNMLCAAANGEIIWHLDSDDWSHPERMADQVWRLEASGKALTGYSSILFRDEATSTFYRFESRLKPYALGTSLCFTKGWWRRRPFLENKPTGSDNHMFYAARDANEYIVAPGDHMIIARNHADNTNANRSRFYPQPEYTKVEAPAAMVAR